MSANPDAAQGRSASLGRRADAALWRMAGPWWLFLIASVGHHWRWAHILLGIFFIIGAIWAFARPFNAFWALASVLGLLLIFKGTLDIIGAVMTKDVNSAWWLGLVAGILELILGFWTSQQAFPARGALLLLWVGFFALFRGISEIVVAFEVRHRQRA